MSHYRRINWSFFYEGLDRPTKYIISKKAKKAKYQKINTNDFQESQLEMVKKFELSFEKLRSLKK